MRGEVVTLQRPSCVFLLVEDDPRIAPVCGQKGLREQSYAVDVATTGDGALYQISINTYDLAILDVMIPGPDGFEVCGQIRKSGLRIPILMLTAKRRIRRSHPRSGQRRRRLSDEAFRLWRAAREVKGTSACRPVALQPAKIAVDDLELDTAAQTASRAGHSIPLTSKEYSLLEYLARNASGVLRREEIAEHVWDETFDPFSNLIEVYVNRLRRKVDIHSATPLIHTRRGVGYVLRPAERSGRMDSKKRLSGGKDIEIPPKKDHV